jgi:hypothetical protein
MTLMVKPYKRLEDGSIVWIDLPDPAADLAGVESARQTFWGSATAQRLGLVFAPTLRDTDIWAEGDDLIRLEHEIMILLTHLDTFIDEQDYWQFRLANVQAAIVLARSIPNGQGGVYIG